VKLERRGRVLTREGGHENEEAFCFVAKSEPDVEGERSCDAIAL